MRRTMLVSLIATAMVVMTAAPALAGHCINLSKQADAGNHGEVHVNARTGETEIVSLKGGYADIHVDLDGDGDTDLVEEGVLIGRNHSPQFDATEGPWVNPGASAKAMSDHATHEQGIIVPHH